MPEDLTNPGDPADLSDLAFPVVGIGASVGGLNAVLGFFEHMPADSGMSFLVVLHVPPKDDDSAVGILARRTAMPVIPLTGRTTLVQNHIYLVPGGHDLAIDATSASPVAPSVQSGQPTSIDRFFRLLADTLHARAVGVVLSGSGSDGAIGLARIRELGGVALAQAPDEADHSSMPRACIASGAIDFVLPVAEIPAQLIRLWHNARQVQLPPLDAAPASETAGSASGGEAGDIGDADGGRTGTDGFPVVLDEAAGHALAQIMETLRLRTRHDFRHYKRATVLRRIGRRMQIIGSQDLAAYHTHLLGHAEETAALLQDMLISVTSFFRDPAAMESLDRNVLAGLLANRGNDDPLRVWVVGCATGEEAYSISILLHERISADDRAPGAGNPAIQVFATDIDDRALAIARNGLYPGAIANDVSPARLHAYFSEEEDSFRVSTQIRESVLFASHNVLRDAPFSRIDLIVCRNLLIYLDREAQSGIMDIFRYALKRDGHLFLGTAESADSFAGAFTPVDAKNRIYLVNPRSAEQDGPSRIPALAGQPAGASRPARSGDPSPVEPVLKAHPTAGGILDLHQRMLLECAPPSVLVDSELKILHMTSGAGRFMVHSSGSPSSALMSNVHPDIRVELRAALMSAAESGKPVEVRGVPAVWQQGSLQERGAVNLRVMPRRDPRTGAKVSVVLLEAVTLPQLPPEEEGSHGADTATALADHRTENRRLKDQLKQIIARFDASSEELRASNAELAAINHAWRRSTEELEVKKEELQSMNEELIAVNHELKAKVDETGQIQDDLQNLSAAGGIIALFVDRAMYVKRFTPAAAELFGLSSAGPAQTLTQIADQLDHASLPDDAAESFRTLRPIERKVRAGDGRSYLARTQPYRTMRNSIDGAVLHLTDLTALQQVEDRLRSTLEVLHVAATTSRSFAVLTMDQHGRVDRWHADAERVFGYDSQEMVGQSFEALSTPEARSRGVPAQVLRAARDRGRAEAEQTYRRKDGSEFHGSCVIAALREDPNKGFVQAIRDLTDDHRILDVRNQLLAREQELARELQSLRRTQHELLESLSGELKRPLNLIQVNADMLMRLPETRGIPVAGKVAESISKAVADQSELIDSLRDLSLAQRGQLTLQVQKVSLRELVESVVRRRKDRAAAKSLLLDFSCEDDPFTAICDPARTEQIVRNLVDNAIKFTDHGTVAVSLAREGSFARLAIADTGRGIAPDELAAVFGAPDQPAPGSPKSSRGLGIGLALVAALVAAHDGRVEAHSEGTERGATFSVWLQLAEQAVESARALTQETNPLAGLRVVLVDDSVDVLTSFGALLSLEGAKVDTFDNAAAALKRLSAGSADLLISDIGMPGMDGYELISAVRQKPELSGLPAIALTGYGRTRDPGHAVRSGFNAHTTKPASVEELKNIVALLKSL